MESDRGRSYAPRVATRATRARTAAAAPAREGLDDGLPRIGEVIRRLRRQRSLSLRQVAEASGLSPSFLSAVERGESDIAVQRLAQLARVFDHDVASLLGYSLRHARPRLLTARERKRVSRGTGVDFLSMRVPGTSLNFMVAVVPPGGRDERSTHAGIDLLYVADGELVLVFDGVDYPLQAGDCVVWPSSHLHYLRNDSPAPARAIGFATETLY